ncbi:uncharacterized protein PG998_002362 [Apiospora kogelbergensis]|uniref:uncharacterized protein n=1 Tax=Apiospora kogelbergensis TaxID=1337665 RepID=UPI00312E2BF1
MESYLPSSLAEGLGKNASTVSCPQPFGVQFGTLIVALGFTKATSLWRPALLPILFLVPYLQLPHLDAITYAPARGVLGGATIFTVVLYVATVLVHKFSYIAQGPTSSAGGLVPARKDELSAGQQRNGNSGRVLSRLRFGLEIGAGARFAATKWPVNNIPPFSRDDPNFIPTKAGFQRSLAPKVVLSWLLLMALNFVPPNNDSQTSFASRRIPILSRLDAVGSEEIYTRFGAVVGYWLVQYILHIAVHGSMAMAAVALGFEVAAWPPIFGAATDCYTIRRFWGMAYPFH